MKIAFDASPLSNDSRVRGIGFYTESLRNALQKYFPNNSYDFIENARGFRSDVDLIHYPYFDPFFLTLPKNKIKTVVTVHDLTPIVLPNLFPAGIRGKLKWQIQKHRLRGVDAVITDSFSSKKDIGSLVGFPESKTYVTYLAAGDQFKRLTKGGWEKSLRKKYNLPNQFALYVGDVTPNKNLPRLVEAIKKIDFPLVMVGKALINKDYDMQNPWNKDLHYVQVATAEDKRFIFPGFVSDVELVQFYNLAAVCVLPSLYEGFGLPILQAMQCGCPVVTSEEGSLKEVGDSAVYFVDAYNTESIANGIKELLGSKQLRDAFSKKGLLQSKKFNWKKTAEETIRVYEEVLGKQ